MKTYDQFINEARVEAESKSYFKFYSWLGTWSVAMGAVTRSKKWDPKWGSSHYNKQSEIIKTFKDITNLIMVDIEDVVSDSYGEEKTGDVKGHGGAVKGKYYQIKGFHKKDDNYVVKPEIIDGIFNKTIKDLNVSKDQADIRSRSFSSDLPTWVLHGKLDEHIAFWKKFLENLKQEFRGNLAAKKYDL